MAAADEGRAGNFDADADDPFAHIQRRFDARVKAVVAVLHPGDYYVAEPGELVSTVLGSCVSACIRDGRQRFGGMNHFMLPQGVGEPGSGWSSSAWLETRYGNVAMERLINEILKRGGHRGDLEVKLVGGGKVLDSLTDVGARNAQFAKEYVRTEGFRLLGEDLGDLYARKVIYDPASGTVRVKRLTRTTPMMVADEVSYLRRVSQSPPAGEVELFD